MIGLYVRSARAGATRPVGNYVQATRALLQGIWQYRCSRDYRNDAFLQAKRAAKRGTELEGALTAANAEKERLSAEVGWFACSLTVPPFLLRYMLPTLAGD